MAAEEFKVVLIGDSGVGKTSFIIRYTEAKFQNVHEATLGVDCKKVMVDVGSKHPPVELRIWDTAGQERFKSIISRFYRSADGVLLMYDVTCKASFDGVLWWLNDVRKHCPDHIPIFLVGNKNEDSRKTEVLEELAQDFAEEHRLILYKTSARDNVNVNQVFHNLAMTMLAEREASAFSDDEDTAKFFNTTGDIRLDLNHRQKKPCCSHLEWRKNSHVV